MSPLQHLVRYGIPAEHKYLLGEFLDTYDLLMLNATAVAYMPAAIASLITQKASRKPYFIDPQTHIFQHGAGAIETTSDKGKSTIKRSIKLIVEAYGEPIKSRVGQKRLAILPADFQDLKVRAGFCERVIRFQAEALNDALKRSDAAKYYRFLERKKGTEVGSISPRYVVAPYFFLSHNTLADWLEINIACAGASIRAASKWKIPLAVQVVLSREVLTNQNLRETLKTQYTSRTRPEVFLVWVDAFSEQRASEDELVALVDLFRGLGKTAPVINLYGGFFSIAAARLGVIEELVGVTHGLEYGEDRPILPVGGGIPTAKFYLPVLHARLAFRDAVRAVRRLNGFKSAEDFHEKVCDCRECRRVIVKDPETEFAQYGETRPIAFSRRGATVVREFPLPETRDRSVRHYMWSKDREYRAHISQEALLRELKRASSDLGGVLGLDSTKHCEIWARVLSRSGG